MDAAGTSNGFLASHCRLVTRDLDEARERVGRMWERHKSYLRRGRTYGLRWHQVDLPHASLSYIQSQSPIRVICGPISNVFHFTMLEEGYVRYCIDGREAEAMPSRGVVYASGQELRLDIEPFRTLLLSFHGCYVQPALTRRFARVPPLDAWRNSIPLDAPPAASLRSLCRWMGHELDQPGTPLLSSPPTAANFERVLLALFLDCLEAGYPTAETKAEDVGVAQLHLIESWLDSHFTEPIGVEDMAEVAQVSVRAVQNAFRRLRRCTPTEALARRRLNHALKMLRRPLPKTSVTQVAMDCGFFHLGRFAGRYVQAFGEKPSETLARARHRSA